MYSFTVLSFATTAFSLVTRQAPPGVATFNDYVAQGSTVCCPGNTGGNGPASPLFNTNGQAIFAAAAGDISPTVGKGVCSPDAGQPESSCEPDPSNPGHAKQVDGYVGPACPTSSYCGAGVDKCYTVTPLGGFNGAQIPGQGTLTPITVQVIDVCPRNHAQNYCPIVGLQSQGIPADDSTDSRSQRCEMMGTDSLDIDVNAYGVLVGRGSGPKGSGDPNLSISIAEVPCPGGAPANCMGFAG